MATKFIGVDGFGKIESLKFTRKTSKKNTVKYFAKKVSVFAKGVLAQLTAKTKTSSCKESDKERIRRKRAAMAVKRAKRNGTYVPAKPAFDFKLNIDFSRMFRAASAFAAPVCACALLVLTICFWTCADRYLTVSYEGEDIAVIENDTVLTEASLQMNKALANNDADSTVAVIRVSYPTLTSVETSTASDVYEKMVDTSELVTADAAGLYIDGEFYGATADTDELESSLAQILSDAKAKYDDTTTADFNNAVEVVDDVYLTDELLTASEIMTQAQGKFSVRIETDYVVEETISFATITEKDNTQDTTYKKVKVEGSEGLKEVTYRLVYVDGVMVDSVYQSEAVITEATDEVLVVGTLESYKATGNFAWPVPYTHNITSGYGPRWGTIHTGIDIAAAGCNGKDIVASDAGVVEFASSDSSGYGKYVIIDHGNGYKTLYGHCSALYVTAGQKVKQGQSIAAIGSTGYSTGPHLHFEIRQGSSRLNPSNFL